MPPKFTPNIQWTLLKSQIRSTQITFTGLSPSTYSHVTTRGFPHSEILGSLDIQLLPEAYRSRSRPSSASDA